MGETKKVGGNLLWSVFSFYSVGSRDLTQVVKLGGKHLCKVSCLSGPRACILKTFTALHIRSSSEEILKV